MIKVNVVMKWGERLEYICSPPVFSIDQEGTLIIERQCHFPIADTLSVHITPITK